MVPEEKLDQIRGRFEFLEARLNAGAAVADLPALSREYAELKPVVERIAAWRALRAEEAETERLLGDPEMRPLAEELVGKTALDLVMSVDEAIIALDETVHAGDAVLVKASNSIGLAKLVAHMVKA